MKKLLLILVLFPLLSFAQPTGVAGLWTFPANVTITGDLTYSLRHAEMLAEGINYTPNLTLNTWLKIAPPFTVTEADNITAVADSMTIVTPGSYTIYFTFTMSAGNNEDYMVGITKNGTVVRSVRRTGLGAGNYVGGQIFKYLDGLVAGDDIAIKIQNISNNNDPTFTGVYMYVQKVY
jgi:hypothetical protein